MSLLHAGELIRSAKRRRDSPQNKEWFSRIAGNVPEYREAWLPVLLWKTSHVFCMKLSLESRLGLGILSCQVSSKTANLGKTLLLLPVVQTILPVLVEYFIIMEIQSIRAAEEALALGFWDLRSLSRSLTPSLCLLHPWWMQRGAVMHLPDSVMYSVCI